ncbi:MAG: hypothetical protein IJ646_09705 [Clostridia bacterium]|nr:hypothetical protein [Clostridia bacterium]
MKKILALLMALMLLVTTCAMAETADADAAADTAEATDAAPADAEAADDWSFPDGADDSEEDFNNDVLAGGWELTTYDTAKGGDTLKALFDKAVEGLTGVVYTPVALLGTQVVSGMNYCILCHCDYTDTDTPYTGWALVYLNEAFGGEATVTNVVELDIEELADKGIFH